MSLAVGICATYIVTDLGELYSWGENDVHQLGQPHPQVWSPGAGMATNPTKICQFGNMVSSVTSQNSRAACLMQDGSVWTFGQANRTTMAIRPFVLSPPLHTCRDELDGERGMQVECGEMFTFILTDIGSVFQLRVVDIEIAPEDGLPGGIDPDTVLTAASGYRFYRENQPAFRIEREYFSNMPINMIAAGNFHVLASGLYQGLWTWGTNTDGCLGRGMGTELTTNVPVPVPEFQAHRLTYLAASLRHSMVVSAGTTGRRDDGGVFGWGSNLAGQLGVGYASVLHVQPVRIDPVYFDNENITMIACAQHCTAAVSETGKMWLFGNTNRMSSLHWSVKHGLHARGIVDHIDSDDSSGDSGSDIENETDHQGKENETKYIHKIFPQRVRQEHVLGARFSLVAVSDSHVAATTEDGHLYMFYGGIIPVMYRPMSQPTSLIGVDPVLLLNQPYFGGRRVASRRAQGGSGMSRRDATQYADGRFRSNAEYSGHMNRARVRRRQHWQRQDAVADEAAAAAAAFATVAAAEAAVAMVNAMQH